MGCDVSFCNFTEYILPLNLGQNKDIFRIVGIFEKQPLNAALQLNMESMNQAKNDGFE